MQREQQWKAQEKETRQSPQHNQEQHTSSGSVHASQQDVGNQFCKQEHWQKAQRNNKCCACPQWFLQKYIFLNYKHKDSHFKATKILADKLARRIAWIKLCWSNNNWLVRLGPSGIQPPPKPPNPPKPKFNILGQPARRTLGCIPPPSQSNNTPVLPPRQDDQTNNAHMSIRSTDLGEYLLCKRQNLIIRERATWLNNSRKQKIANSPADIKDADSATGNIKCGDKNHPPQTDETHHPKVWPHGLISILQEVIRQKEIEQATPILVGPHANLIPQKEIEWATPSLVRPQVNLIPQREIKWATPSLVGPQADLFP